MAYTTRFGKLVRLHPGPQRTSAYQRGGPELRADKGEPGGACNRTACQRPNTAYWFNHSTRKYYCRECAHWLNTDEFNKRDAMNLYGHDLCTFDPDCVLGDA